MNKIKHIIDLAIGKMSIEGYNYIVSLIKYYIKKYNWPKIIIDENSNTDIFWSDEDILSLTQQFLIFVLEKQKLKNYKKIPESYIEYYFKTIIVSYVSDKIKYHQNKIGLSYDDTKRVSLEILNDKYFNKKIGKDIFWNSENIFPNILIIDNEIINQTLNNLPKIPITEKTKHYKPRIKTALIDVFSLINKPIKQNVLINQVFKLFDQSSFAVNEDEQLHYEIREEFVSHAIERIIESIDKSDIPIYLDYFFSETKNSLNALANKYSLPKSTVHYKTSQFSKIIFDSLTPNNEQEGVWFLEKLHKSLDEMK